MLLAYMLVFMTQSLLTNKYSVNAQNLNQNGLNVCSRRYTVRELYGISVRHTVSERYRSCCSRLWNICWSYCLKTRYRTRLRYEQRSRTSIRTSYECCTGYRQRGSECPIAICDNPCINGNCSSPNICSCNVGFNGTTCNEDINECEVNNGGCDQNCTNSFGSYQCGCFEGYMYNNSANICDDVNECEVSNGGCQHQCQNNNGSYICQCNEGFSLGDNGKNCFDLNECETLNGGCQQECINTNGSFHCQCHVGLFLNGNGRTCADHDECKSGNHGCQQKCLNSYGSYFCGCFNGYQLNSDNKTCSDVNECGVSNGGCEHQCTNTNGSYVCYCKKGFYLDWNGKTCSDHDECLTSNHGCQHKCVNEHGSFSCRCEKGYELNNDNKTCSDVNECGTLNGGCDHQCKNANGSYICECNKGFFLDGNGKTCSDHNECNATSHDCQQMCLNRHGSYACACFGGYQLNRDNKTCSDINECEISNGGCQHQCININGSYTCQCNEGFILNSNGKTCTDQDECSGGNHGCQQKCVNKHGSYYCKCLNGYQLNSDNTTCSDINECDALNGGCEHLCQNNNGSYNCECNKGFFLDGNGKTCSDHDECRTSNHGCQQKCVNMHGGYSCACYNGYGLNTDNKTCTDVDECQTLKGGCQHKCENTNGSYSCICNEGFFLDGNGKTCSDLDECRTRTHECQQLCLNSYGSYSCMCISGYQLNSDGKNCSDINECMRTFHRVVSNGGCQHKCNNTIGSYLCSCNDGYALAGDDRSCLDINECVEGKDDCDQLCTNRIGSYNCMCRDGYYLHQDGRTCVGEVCEVIPPLQHGNSSCVAPINETTDTTCSFFCNKGFKIDGSTSRTCQANHHWNGTTNKCKRRLCQNLNPPAYGRLSLPCSPYFESTCKLACIDTHYLVGHSTDRCTVTENDTMIWRNKNECKESTLCTPNPCKHNGHCTVVKNNFECDCTRTFHRGKTCERGILIIPEIHIVSINETNDNLIIHGYPYKSITVALSPSPHFLIEPTNITLTKNKTSATFVVTGTKYGFWPLKYNVTGENAADFDVPGPTFIFVYKTNESVTSSFGYSSVGILKEGCFTEKVKDQIFLSNLQWSANKTTRGVAQILAYGNKTLPLSLTGGKILSSGKIETYNIGNVIEVENATRFINNCSKEGVELVNIGSILRTNAFEYSIQEFFNTFSPSWFKLIAALHINEYYAQDLVAELYSGYGLKKKSDECIKGFTFKSNSTYYIHQTNQIYNVLLPNSLITLPNSYTKCLIFDLNDKHIYFGFSGTTYMAPETKRIYDNLVNLFSKEISSFMGFDIISKKLSFEMVGSSHTLHIYGKRYYNLSTSDLKVELSFEGKTSLSNDKEKVILAEASLIYLSITFTLDNEEQSLQINGLSSEATLYGRKKSKKVVKTSVIVSPVTSISQTGNFSNIFIFSNLSPVTVNIEQNMVLLPFSTGNAKNNLSHEVNKAVKTVNTTLNFLKRLPEDEFLKDDLKHQTVSINQLFTALLSYGRYNRSAYQYTEYLRLLFSEAVKEFSMLLDHYIQKDPQDHIGMRMSFMNFKNEYNEFIQNTHVSRHWQYAASNLSGVAVEGKGKVCLHYFCFNQITIAMDLKQKKVVGQFTKKDNLGNYIKIYQSTRFYYDLTNNTNSLMIKGEVVVFNQTKEINMSIQASVLSFIVYASIGNVDLIPLHVEASLEAVLQNDPLYFTFSGNLEKSYQMKTDIQNSMKDYFSKLEESLNLKENTINSSQLPVERLWKEMNNATSQKREKLEQLKKQIQSLNENITTTEGLLKRRKERYIQALQSLSNHTASEKEIISEQCQPKLCTPHCLPSFKKKLCRKQRKIYLVDEQCYIKNKTTVFYRHVAKNKTIFSLNYKKKYSCWSECPPSKDIYENEKWRGILSKLTMVITPSILEKLKSLDELEARSDATSNDFSFADSLIGSCYRYCGYDYNPIATNKVLQEYEKYPLVKSNQQTRCESKLRHVNGSFESIYQCDVQINCKQIQIDKSCLENQRECKYLRKSITDSLLDKSVIKKSFENMTKTSFIYDLLITKKNILSEQLQNAEQELDLADALNNSAYKTLISLQSRFKKFKDATQKDRLLITKYKNQPMLFRPKSIKFNFTYTSGMEFPQQFPIEVDASNLVSTVLFDVNNYEKSVRDISIEIKDLVKEATYGKRMKRSTKGLKPNLMDQKCMSIQRAEIFLLEVLETFKDKIENFSEIKSLKTEQIRVNVDLGLVKENISTQLSEMLNESARILLNKELDEIFEIKLSNQMQKSLTDSWNFTLIEIILSLHSFVDNLQQTNCVNLLDCVQFYTDLLNDTIYSENIGFSSNVTEKIKNWKANIIHLITAYPDLKHSQMLTTSTSSSIIDVNPRQWFCGSPPILKTLLRDMIKINEGERIYLRIEILNEKHSYKVIWKRNNYILQGYTTTVLNKTVTKVDEGYYSCEIINKFGRSDCGRIFVKVFKNITFTTEPQDIMGYLHSSKKKYLTCTVQSNTSAGTFTWFFRKFHEPATSAVDLFVSNPYLEINQDTASSSGFYSCQYDNMLKSAVSREAIVHVLKTSVAVERIGVTMLLSKLNPSRDRREVQVYENGIKSALAKLLLVKAKHIEISNLSKEDDSKERITLTLYGSNLTSYLEHYKWNGFTDKIIKERDNILLRLSLLYMHVNKSSNFTADEKIYSVDSSLMSVSKLEPLCPYGQSLSENGFICADCPAGTKYDGISKCLDCPLHSYQDRPAQLSCKPCPRNYVTESIKAVSIIQCKEIKTTTTTRTTITTTTLATTIVSQNISTSVNTNSSRSLVNENDDNNNLVHGLVGGIVGGLIFVICVAVLVCFCKRRYQNSYNIHIDEEEEKDENDVDLTNIARQPDSSIKRKQDKKPMGFSNPVFTDIDTDENMLDSCSKTNQSLNEVKSVDMFDIKDFPRKEKEDMFSERQVEPNHYVDYRSLSSE